LDISPHIHNTWIKRISIFLISPLFSLERIGKFGEETISYYKLLINVHILTHGFIRG
jgi:hypothetical protein